MPRHQADVLQHKDGSVTIQYKPQDPGLHEVNLLFNEQTVEGSPMKCHVDKVGGAYVTAYGSGLHEAASGKQAEFFACGGGKDLDISIKGPSKTDMKKSVKDNITHVTFLPMSPGEYVIDIKYKGKHIHGSPFSAKVSGEGRKRSQYALTGTSEIVLGGKNVDLTGMVGTLTTPKGNQEPCLLKRATDGQLVLSSFQPKQKGNYKVVVTQEGNDINGSPFSVSVGDAEVCSAAKVKTSGVGLKETIANKFNQVEIDLNSAGHGALAVSIEGPHRSDIDVKEQSHKRYLCSFKPHEPGIYLMNIRFGDDHVTGSPFLLNVGGEPSGRVRETFNKDIKAAETTAPGSRCQFQLKIPGTNPLDMEATLTSPSGKTDMCEIADLEDSLYDIKFSPAEMGVHIVSLKHKGLHISGSPFQYTVGPAPSGGPHKVEVGGPGLEKGEVGMFNDFNIYTREAGAGSLNIAIEGPSKAILDVVDRGNGYTTVSYKVSEPGDYGIHIKYSDFHVPDSPCKIAVVPEATAAKLVTLAGLRDRGLQIEKPVTFNVNLNGARGELQAHVDTPSGEEKEIMMQEMDRDMYGMRFIPHENGIHYIHIKLNEAHIPGSPFPMLVGKMGADAALVLAKGDGLTTGEAGKICKFVVQTTNAGSGSLACTVEGPSKVALMCTEVDEGYEFSYTPMAPGDYFINIKYCNVTIAACPTKATIRGDPAQFGGRGKKSDIIETSGIVVETVEKKEGVTRKRFSGNASKVTAKGNGLTKGFSNRLANFNIDVSGAGNALLSVGMITPTGNPIEELSYRKQRGTVYQVNYKSKEKGAHAMTVRWGNDEIPGSPFSIKVL